METQNYNIYKVSEGGIGQREAVRLLKEAGIKCKPGYSPFVGQVAVEVTGSKTDHKKASDILYGV